MTVIGTAYIEVQPETEGFAKQTSNDVTSVAKKAAGAFAAAFVVKEAFQFFSGLIADAEESRKVMAQTAQAILSTGGAAHVSAKDVDDLASSLSRKTGIDDEAIASASNLLLTFTNVRNEAGKGNDVFNQATGILLDMSKVLGTDASGSAIQLGKALNDPVAGIAALTRVGVTFTDQQKEQIKTLVESGDTLGAQKIILAELGKEFGGQAAAQATATEKLSVMWGNFREELGGKLLPIVDTVGNALLVVLPRGLDAAARAFEIAVSPVKAMTDLWDKNRVAAGLAAAVLAGPVVIALGEFIAIQARLAIAKLVEGLSQLAEGFETLALKSLYAVDAVKAAAGSIYAAIGPVGLAIAVIAALGVGFVLMSRDVTKTAKAFADNYIASLNDSSTKTEVLEQKVAQLRAANEEMIKSLMDREGVDRRHADNLLQGNDLYVKNTTVLKSLTAELDKNKIASQAATEVQRDMNSVAEQAGRTAQNLADKHGVTREQVELLAAKMKVDLKGATEESTAALELQAARLAESNPLTLALQDALAKLSDKTADATEKSRAFKTALDLLIGGNIDAEKAVVSFYGQIDTLGAKLKENGTNLDFHTAKGRENLTSIQDTVAAIRNHIQSMKDSGASSNDLQRALEGDTKAFNDQLKAAGFTTKQVQDLNKQYGLVPSSLATVLTADFDQVYQEFAKLQAKVGFNEFTKSFDPKGKGTIRVLGAGGYFPGNRPELAVVGDSREVMLPLDNPARMRQVLAEAGLSGGSSSGAPWAVVNLNLEAGVTREMVDYATRVAKEQVVEALEQVADKKAAVSPGGSR